MEGVTSAHKPSDLDTDEPYGIRQHFEVHKELADCYAERGDADRAAELYRQAAGLRPDDPEPDVGLGTLAVQAQRLDDAVRHFQDALAKDDACAEAHGGLAMAHQRAGRYDEAFVAYLACLERDRDNLVALLGLFQTSCQMGTFGKIIHYLQVYLDRHPGDTAVLFCLGSLQAKEGRLDEARQTLQTVLLLDPDKDDAAELLRDIEQRMEESAPQVRA